MKSTNTHRMPWDNPAIKNLPISPRILGVIIICVLAIVFLLFQFLLSESEGSVITAQSNQISSEQNEELSKKQICIHVTGEVNSPGIVYLDSDTRVNDAIEAAGGFTEGADTQTLNLARVVVDGEQIVVPSINSEQVSQTSQSQSSSSYVGDRLNINRASQEELETLSGIGPSTASKIISDREANGPYSTIEDLMRVSGIGEKKFASIEAYICVG